MFFSHYPSEDYEVEPTEFKVGYELRIKLAPEANADIDEFNSVSELLTFSARDTNVHIRLTQETLWQLEKAIKKYRHKIAEHLLSLDEDDIGRVE